MNKFLKAFALMAAVVMSFSVLAACGDKADEPVVSGDSSQNIPADNGDKTQSDDSAQAPAGDEEYAEPSLTIDGKSIDISDNPVILTIGGVDIHFDEYRYMFKICESYYAVYNGITPDMWEGNEENFKVFKDEVRDAIIERNYGNIVAKKYGLELGDEDYEQVELGMENERAQFETEEEFQKALAVSGLKEDLLRRLIASGVMDDKVYNDLYAGENARFKPNDEDVRKNIRENYARVYHLLISNEHFAETEGYENATEEELKAAAKKLAEEKLDDIKSGEDIYELAQSIGDDPGMKDNPDGYLFTYGEMVPEFEEASFALDVDELSGVVETDYGYHIIRKLELESYIEEHFEDARTLYANNFFNSEVDKILEDAEIVYSEYYDGISYDSIT